MYPNKVTQGLSSQQFPEFCIFTIKFHDKVGNSFTICKYILMYLITAWTISFSFLNLSIKYSAYHGSGSRYLNEWHKNSRDQQVFFWMGLTEFLYLLGSPWNGLQLCIFSNAALPSYPQVSCETLRNWFMAGWLCNMSPWLGYVSQYPLPGMLPVRTGHERFCVVTGGQMRGSSTLRRLVQEHQALLQFTRHSSAGSPRWYGQQSGLRPGLQLLHLPQDLPSAFLILGPDAYLTLWWRAPASSAGHPRHRSWRWWEADMASRPSLWFPARAHGRQCVLRLPLFTSIFPSRLPALQTSSSSIRCKDNSLIQTVQPAPTIA